MLRRTQFQRPVPGSAALERQQARAARTASRRAYLDAVTPLPARREEELDDPPPYTVAAVLERDSYRCVIGGETVVGRARGTDWALHHRKLRSRGAQHLESGLWVPDEGGKHSPANLITLCTPHHEQVHRCSGFLEEDEAEGWIVPSYVAPSAWRVFWLDPAGVHRWVHLLDDGRAVASLEEL